MLDNIVTRLIDEKMQCLLELPEWWREEVTSINNDLNALQSLKELV